MKKRHIVILTGAGFPLMWEAPTSCNLTTLIKETVRQFKNIHDQTKEMLCNSDSFEQILAAIEDQIYYKLDVHNKHYYASFYNSTIIDNEEELWRLYKDCINKIIDEIYKYESAAINSTEDIAEIRKFMTSNKFGSINYYTTNYDEVVPNAIQPNNTPITYNYSILEHNRRKMTFTNLHGSIHLSFDLQGFQYEIYHSHSAIPSHLSNALQCYGGNPGEQLLFTPIITGKNKAQRIMDKHFSHGFVTFANDLSRCDTILIMGYSFSDPHINAILRQYTYNRNVCIIIVTKESVVCGSAFENNFNNVWLMNGRYTGDTEADIWYHYDNPKLYVYKQGAKSFMELLGNIDNILSNKLCNIH
jgi:hypothetical protein